MFELTHHPIVFRPPTQLHPHAGGVVTFEGRVRAINEGKTVTALDYEAYPALALSEGNTILKEALAQFSLFSAYAIHRTGHLAVGDVAVWVYATAMHRREAFQATEYIIHSIKHRLPIWKKEWYADGASQWVNCSHDEAV
jgi:adenylyltransferase/sulfurtransferase